jgi:hypothetical protein
MKDFFNQIQLILFVIPCQMNTMYRMTKRGREFTFTSDDGNGEEGAQQSHQPLAIVVTELLGCQSAPFCRHCLLYEYPQQQSDGGFKDFRWISGPLIQMPFGQGARNDHGRQQQRRIQVNNILLFFPGRTSSLSF